MEKENVGISRITRSRAAALQKCQKTIPPVKATTQAVQKPPSRKRAALDSKNNNACLPRKKRAVLQDVTNVSCENTYKDSPCAAKIQVNVPKVCPSVAVSSSQPQTRPKVEILEGRVKAEPKSEDITCTKSEYEKDDGQLNTHTSGLPSQPHSSPKKERKGVLFGCLDAPSNPDVTDIDSDKKNHLLCSLYVSDIYNNLRVAELARRPYSDFMETVQRDITQGMRGILVDWLVEVSEEYKLVPDTLYLTVYLIDTFLARNYIERQRLQLLGITCMLIASKYEEICAPRVEEFCFITDNTYSREEVLKMESEVLKYFGFQVFTPTAKTFLRRFLRAAQASYKSPSVELEYLANYLAELTLMDYGFLSFVPSVIAASAVFLARWTLDQSSHPWNPTLEHYTSYKASDLRASVHSLQDLQLNAKGCPLDAIRMKYRQQKFKSVATLASSRLLETLF